MCEVIVTEFNDKQKQLGACFLQCQLRCQSSLFLFTLFMKFIADVYIWCTQWHAL